MNEAGRGCVELGLLIRNYGRGGLGDVDSVCDDISGDRSVVLEVDAASAGHDHSIKRDGDAAHPVYDDAGGGVDGPVLDGTASGRRTKSFSIGERLLRRDVRTRLRRRLLCCRRILAHG